MLEVNTAFLSGHFQKYGVVKPSVDSRRSSGIQYIENTIGFELWKNGCRKRTSKFTVYIPHEQTTVKHQVRMCDPRRKKSKKV